MVANTPSLIEAIERLAEEAPAVGSVAFSAHIQAIRTLLGSPTPAVADIFFRGHADFTERTVAARRIILKSYVELEIRNWLIPRVA